MTNTDTRDISATISQITALTEAGCDIVRVAVPDFQSTNAISEIKKKINIPLVADIHYDYKLAIASIKAGADKIRINPGNIGALDKTTEIIKVAKDYNVPIRIGVNSGSLPKDIENKFGVSAEALVEAAARYVEFFQAHDFFNIILSVKSSSVPVTFEAYRLLSNRFTCPLHIGVTEAGIGGDAIVKSAACLGTLLLLGIGDTLRVSLTADPIEEVKTALSILRALQLRHGVNFISCPTCGRTKVNLFELAGKVKEYVSALDRCITVAVMGCNVNGPGEAKHADIGVACGDGFGVLFKKGEIIGKYSEDELFDAFVREVSVI